MTILYALLVLLVAVLVLLQLHLNMTLLYSYSFGFLGNYKVTKVLNNYCILLVKYHISIQQLQSTNPIDINTYLSDLP